MQGGSNDPIVKMHEPIAVARKLYDRKVAAAKKVFDQKKAAVAKEGATRQSPQPATAPVGKSNGAFVASTFNEKISRRFVKQAQLARGAAQA
jgi:hypothetical protein